MKAVILCFLAYGAVALASVLDQENWIADNTFLEHQKKVLGLLNHVFEPSELDYIRDIAKNYDFEANINKFRNATVVHEFLELYNRGFLSQTAIFTVMIPRQRRQAVALYRLLSSAQDFDTFYSVACWARMRINSGMFVYSFTVAVRHHEQLRGIVLPALYEINPYHFVDMQTIMSAFYLKMQSGIYPVESVGNFGVNIRDNVYTINVNNSYYGHQNVEQKLSYFTEDIGLNSYYYNFHVNCPFWMDGKECGIGHDRRSELYYYLHQQLLARYYMQRSSMGLGEILRFSWTKPVENGYYNNLGYANGIAFPSRPNNFVVGGEWRDEYEMLEGFERFFTDILLRGYIQLPSGQTVPIKEPKDIEYLGKLIQNNPESLYRFRHYFFIIARASLGGRSIANDEYHIIPSVLEQYETCLRDPVFWQLNKKLVYSFIMFKRLLPSYTSEELTFKGVKIENVEVDKLVTYFDKFDVDITNAVYKNLEEFNSRKEQFIFRARQERLNHEPFNVRIELTSEEAVKSVVRIFLGPKTDVYNLKIHNYNFVELDTFLYDLTVGDNVIERNSREFYITVQDSTPARDLYRQVMVGLSGQEQYKTDSTLLYGFPDRLMLPRGTVGGFPFQIYVIVSPWVGKGAGVGRKFGQKGYAFDISNGGHCHDGRSLGYPFDRRIEPEFFRQPNMFWKDVNIYHMVNYEPNTTM